ncbi:hypothetical protein P43SY_005686 [Pythium insidiosum]|uniref:Cyclin-dependent kinase 2 homolog n=1 Tax=Pythium insidiosum TaxID=114742 RepID=A0AAD5LHA9_PYTIN|nr:hypothetical protein P43SY_005686 [Pythium insidiosum]
MRGGAVADDAVDAFFEPLGVCRDVEDFEKLNRIGEGTYGTVYRARDRRSQRIVALKRVLLHNEGSDGFPITALREIKLLKRLRHPNCVQLLDVVVGRKRSSVFLVFEYCEHDLALLLRAQSHRVPHRHPFTESELKRIMLSILHAVEHLHAQSLVHRDIKLSNVLYDRYGAVKLADFGLARELATARDEPLTPKVVTLWYRAPEILLGCDRYTTAVDVWSCGCIFAELLLQDPLFPGTSDLDQLDKIFKVLGRPSDHIWPGMSELPNADKLRVDSSTRSTSTLHKTLHSLSPKGLDLLTRMLTYDPAQRITAREALEHPFFREKPFPQEASMMPTFPSLHEDMKSSESKRPRDAHETQSSLSRRHESRFGQAFGRDLKRRHIA